MTGLRRGLTSAEFEASAKLQEVIDDLVDLSGLLTTIASTVADSQTTLSNMYANDVAVVDAMPNNARSKTKISTRVFVQSSTATTVSLVAAVASQTTRLRSAVISVGGATILEIMDGTTTKKYIRTYGPANIILDARDDPWVVTTANTALQYKSSAAVQIDFDAEYETSA